MVETDTEVFLRSKKVLPAWSGGDLPSFGTDAARLSHAKGPVTFRECVGGVAGGIVTVFDELPPHGTPGREAEKPVKRDGSGGGLAEGTSLDALVCCVAAATAVTEELLADPFCISSNSFSCIDPVDIRCAVRSGDLSTSSA